MQANQFGHGLGLAIWDCRQSAYDIGSIVCRPILYQAKIGFDAIDRHFKPNDASQSRVDILLGDFIETPRIATETCLMEIDQSSES